MVGRPEPSPGLLRRIDALARAALPTFTTALLLVLAAGPTGVPALVPATALPCIFFWSLFRPGAMPPPAVFALGALQDLLTLAPLGIGVVTLLVAHGLAVSWRRFLARQSFLFVWLAFCGFAAGIAWADRGFKGIDPRRIPPIAGIWPWRKALIGILASFALVLVCSQLLNGFGMERAIRKMVRENPELAKAREDAATSPAKLAAVENREDAELAKYNLERTGWQDLALLCNLLAIVTVFLSIPLEKRGDKPPPRILLHY